MQYTANKELTHSLSGEFLEGVSQGVYSVCLFLGNCHLEPL